HHKSDGGFQRRVLHRGRIIGESLPREASERPSGGGEKTNLRSCRRRVGSGDQALTEIRHRNIVKLYGFCSHERHSFLVYELVERGSLERVLRMKEEAKEVGWEKRVAIVRDVAAALCYLHHDCSPPIVHRDVSSKNVLLDSEMVAKVADFGTASF
ncbi:hypothetical protein U1Q18_051497, partial [Sarracenia purpurea var. burkii]